MNKVTVIGGGLAGCEAAWQLAFRGIKTELIEMKPVKKTPAHKSDLLAELVCSNSLKAARIDSAAGLLKEEMRRLNSVCLLAADKCAIPAGGALAVDRDIFSQIITEKIKSHPNITVKTEIVTEIPKDGITVIMISHDIDAALKYATHILQIGKDIFFGTRDEYLKSGASGLFSQKGEEKL